MTAQRRRATLSTALPYVAFAAVAVGVLNFMWFMSETVPLQLIPSDGQVIDGRYLLWSKTNAGYVEVSRSFWAWVRFHQLVFFLSWPLVMLAMGYLVFAHFSGTIAGRASPVVTSERVRQVRDSGPMLASTRSGGLIGRTWFSRPLLRIEVFPGGIVIKPQFMAERAILASEIGAVTPEGGLSPQSAPEGPIVLAVGVSEVSPRYRPRGPQVHVEHSGIGMASPFVIMGSGNWSIAQAIGRVADATPAPSPAGVLTPAQDGTAQGARREQLPAAVKVGLDILGIIVGVGLVYSGFAWAIPQLGLFGVAWTVGIILILAWNARRLLVKWRD